jgi:predicted DNA-binding transcriptional regulator AlpA
MSASPETSNRYLTAGQVRDRFGGISDMTLWRWLNDERMAFPKPLVVRRRRLFREDEIARWTPPTAEAA